MQVAVEAIRWLHETGHYEQRLSEIMARRSQSKGKSSAKKNKPVNLGTKNAIGYLNDRYKTLDYIQLPVDVNAPPGRRGESTFTFTVSLENETFSGSGRSKSDAKLGCAEEAIKWLSTNGKITGDISTILCRNKVAFVKGDELGETSITTTQPGGYTTKWEGESADGTGAPQDPNAAYAGHHSETWGQTATPAANGSGQYANNDYSNYTDPTQASYTTDSSYGASYNYAQY